MSLEKAIKHNKEHRKPYYDSRNVDYWCRNHGRCEWCMENRTFQSKREQERTNQMLFESWNRTSLEEMKITKE